MNRTFLFLLLFFSTALFGQNKIEGIGQFKLKKTSIAFLDSLAKEKYFDKFVEISPDTADKYNSSPYAHLCKDARVFYIPEIKISEIKMKEMYLTFYKDTLISINTDWSEEIVEALELKYGSGELKKKDKEVKCTLNSTGETVTYTETMFYQYWENGNIKCTAALGDYHDSNCEKQTLSYIEISVENKMSKIIDCDNKEKRRISNKINSEKKKQLDDF